MSIGTSGKRFDRTWLPALDEATSEEQHHVKFVSPFATWADANIPVDASTQLFDFDTHGYPIFPKVDLLRSTGEDLQDIMEVYLDKVYCASFLIPIENPC